MNKKNKRPLLGDPLDFRPAGNENNSLKTGSGHEAGVSPESAAPEEITAGRAGEDMEGEPVLRSNDTGLGQPDFEPSHEEKNSIRPVSSEEINRMRQDREDLGREFEEKLLDLEKAGIRIPGAIYRAFLWAGIFLGALLGMFMVSQGVRFAGQVQALSFPWNILAGVSFVFFLAVLVVVIAKVMGKFLALKRLTRIDLKALNALAERKRFQALVEHRKDEAAKVLMDYLKGYEVEKSGFSLPGLENKEVDKLRAFKEVLTDKRGYTDSSRWLKEFDESFVHVLDTAAWKRIRVYTRTVALGTAASPIKFIDQMIVLYASLKLVGELLEIYSLRPALGQSAAVLSRAVIQSYLSGIIAEQSEAGVEAFSDYYQNIFGEVSFASGISAVTDATRFIMPKVSEGALNGFLVWRLGKQARKMIRPL